MEMLMSDQWHYSRGGKQVGPVSTTELSQLAASGQLSPTDMVWKEGMGAWVPASTLKGLFNPNPPLLPVPGPGVVGEDARRHGYDDDDGRDDYSRAPSQHGPSPVASAIAAITANEFGISSTMLGGITLVGQLYPLIGAMAAAAAHGGGMAGATLILVLFLLLSIFAGFLGVTGLIAVIRKGQAGGTYCVVGICVSVMSFITSIMMLSAVSSAGGGHRF
jgi:hypothetical protein